MPREARGRLSREARAPPAAALCRRRLRPARRPGSRLAPRTRESRQGGSALGLGLPEGLAGSGLFCHEDARGWVPHSAAQGCGAPLVPRGTYGAALPHLWADDTPPVPSEVNAGVCCACERGPPRAPVPFPAVRRRQPLGTAASRLTVSRKT